MHTGRAGRRCSKVEAAWDSSGRRMYNWEVGLAGFGRSWGDWWWKHSTAAGETVRAAPPVPACCGLRQGRIVAVLALRREREVF